MNKSVNKYMREALLEAEKAAELEEVPVGAVIVRDDEIICKIYTEQNDEDAKNGKGLITDMLTLRDPFEWEGSSISTDFQKRGEDFVKLKQFCLAKGMFRYLKDNPYLTEEDV